MVPPIDRRALLGLIAALPAQALGRPRNAPAHPPAGADEHASTADVAELQRRTFRYFWETTNPVNGLAPDRWPTPSGSSIAAVGFALTAYPVGVERGWIHRAEARDRTLRTLRFLAGLPQGPQARGVAGHHGFFYHYLDMATGLRAGASELSTIDTALLMAGILFCAGWFDTHHRREVEIRRLAKGLYERVEWDWALRDPPLISMGWTPGRGWIATNWEGYDEAMLLYILALGSPTHPVAGGAWDAWSASYAPLWRQENGQEYLTFGPMFGHQYSHVWVDFRGIQDAFMRGKQIDYFENSGRAVLAQKAYADRNPKGWSGYGGDVWGLTACDGPGDLPVMGRADGERFLWYAARGVDGESPDDGTLAPTAAAASLPFAPEAVERTVSTFRTGFGGRIWTPYGFLDAFNPSVTQPAPFRGGKLVSGVGWVDSDYIGIDQGPIVAMIENHRSGLVWRVMRADSSIRLGLRRAGFTGGWLERSA